MSDGTSKAETGKRKQMGARVWLALLAVGLALALVFTVVNLINDQAAYSFTQLISMLLTTFPIMIIVVVGVVLAFSGRRRKHH